LIVKISVAMTTFNGLPFLSAQLDSIFAQKRLPDELIVCDDQSTDETPQLLRKYAAEAPFAMTVVINEQRLGSTKNFEKAIRLSSGDLIALCDQDDVWYPHKLETIERRFESDSELGLLFSNGDLIDEKGAQLSGTMWSKFRFGRRLQGLLKSPGRACDLLLSRFFITGATVVFRSKFRHLCLPVPEGLETFIHDRWIAVMIGALARVEAIEKKLIAYRLHPQQQMGAGKEPILTLYFRPYNCSSDSAALAIMEERLAKAPSVAKPEFLQALDARQRHLATRSALSANFAGRLKGVAAEYLSGRYQRYPMGRGYAVKDLLVGTR
jgi:glycosyltransferase involved in cell wall biosynthesis